jgi:sensor histidine kinase YesM
MLALEQQSLNSSMNRHFIFNALNSIQYYINRQDRLSANRYLSSFAKLIRKNLDSSQVNFTTLSDELERLGLYLEIENMRFKDKFEYEINIAESVDEEVVKIPSMLLQPFLENSIWHGILPQEKKGKISVDIDKNELGQMEIRIKDNGIGIHTSQAQKNGKAEHISQGMNITSGRIELLQKITTEKVTLIGPFEMKNEWGEVLGTQVTIKLPMEYREELIG